jgi:exosortase family protein XrtF
MFQEFKPALLFLFKFLGIYIVGNVAYGLFINQYYPTCDPATRWISNQVSTIISLAGTGVVATPNPFKATISLVLEATKDTIINVFEGCNGINVAIIFLAFIIAYQGTIRRTFIFVIIGLLIIHLFNLARIILLFYQSKNHSPYFYYVHKYLFTAILYAVVVVLWWFWIAKFNGIKNDHPRQTQVE